MSDRTNDDDKILYSERYSPEYEAQAFGDRMDKYQATHNKLERMIQDIERQKAKEQAISLIVGAIIIGILLIILIAATFN